MLLLRYRQTNMADICRVCCLNLRDCVFLNLFFNRVIGIFSKVSIQGTREFKPFIALRAAELEERLLFRFRRECVLVALVVVQRTVVGESQSADVAAERFPPEVGVDMLVQRMAALEHVAARLTLVFVDAVLRLDVHFIEMVGDVELLSIITTGGGRRGGGGGGCGC